MSKKKLRKKQQKTKITKDKNKPFLWLAMAFALFVIGIHQSLTVGFEYSYWIFMLSICLLLLHRYKTKAEDNTSKK
ncbi:MAG: Flp pilus assembly protein TadB [Marivirga sp.]|jgi:Flp pilus assembly protein TadB